MTAPKLTLSRRERREYSIAAAILELSRDHPVRSGLAFEIDEELRKEWPECPLTDERGIMYPYAMEFTRAGLDTATAGKGQELDFPEPVLWLDMLRIQTVLMRAGATVLEGLKGDTAVPFISAAETVSNPAQDPGVDTAETLLTFGKATLTPHTLQTATQFSRQLLALSALVPENRVDRIVMKSIAAQHGVAMDVFGIGGSGTAPAPKGVATQLTGAQLIAFGANGANPSWANMIDIEAAVAAANAAFPRYDDVDRADIPPTSAFVMSPSMRQRIRKTDRAGGTTGRYIMDGERMFDTYPVHVTQAVPQALTKGTSTTCQAIVFGVWQNMYIGIFGPGLELVVDPFTFKKQGMIDVASFQLFDVQFPRTGAFSGSLDALP